MILVNIPNKRKMEWVVFSGNYTKLKSNLLDAGFLETKDGFILEFEENQLKLKGYGPIFFIEFDGSLEFGQVLVNYICQELNLIKKSFRVFVPKTISNLRAEKLFKLMGFELTEKGTHCILYKNNGVSLVHIKEGFYLQVRAQLEKDWDKLFKQLCFYEKELQLLRTYKRKMKVS